MHVAAAIFIVLVAALHVYFLVLEMFPWRTPFGRRTFGITAEAAESSAVLAANQGLYGEVTVSRRILFVQALPAAIAAALLWIS